MSTSPAWKAGEASKEASRVDARRSSAVSNTSAASSVPASTRHSAQNAITTTTEQRRGAIKELLVAGKLSKHLPTREVSRLVIGGHGWDFNSERFVMHSSVLPELCRLSLQEGVDFDAIDFMHCMNEWVPIEPPHKQIFHQEMQEALQSATVGLKYLGLVGNKMGFRPLPEFLSKSIFSEIMHSNLTEDDKALVKQWYIIDDRKTPMHYELQKPMFASLEIQNGADLEDLTVEDRLDAAVRWRGIEIQLRKALTYSAKRYLPEGSLQPILKSELELALPAHQKRSMVVIRQLRGINPQDAKAAYYEDLTESGGADAESAAQLEWWHSTGLVQMVGAEKRMVRCMLNWQAVGISELNSEHGVYLNVLDSTVKDQAREWLELDVKARRSLPEVPGQELAREVQDHCSHTAALMEAAFHLPEVDAVHQALTKQNTVGHSPLFLLGQPGTGKSGVVAALAQRLSQQRSLVVEEHEGGHYGKGRVFPVLPLCVVSRYANISLESSSLRGILASVTAQLLFFLEHGGRVADGRFKPVTQDTSFEELVVQLPLLLQEASRKGVIVLLLDGMDELVLPHHPERSLEWLPQKLPVNVRLLVTLNGTMQPPADGEKQVTFDYCAELVKNRVREGALPPEAVMEMGSMHGPNQRAFIAEVMGRHSRKLPREMEAELSTIPDAGQMLFLSLVLKFICLNKPTPDGQEFKMPRSTESAVDYVLQTLAAIHGEQLLSHVMGFLYAVPGGISELELVDFLSTRDVVLAEHTMGSYTPMQKRMPRYRWAALKSDLLFLGILHRTTFGFRRLLAISHPVFAEIARRRQVSEPMMLACCKTIHGFFNGHLLESFPGRMLTVCAADDALEGDGFNRRKLMLIPQILISLTNLTDGGFADALTSALCDPKYLETRKAAGLGATLFDDLATAVFCISKCGGVKQTVVEGSLSKLFNAIATTPHLSGSQSFGQAADTGMDITVGQRLLEWELERYSRLSTEMKTRLLAYSRDANKASLAMIPDIPSVANLRKARAKSLLPNTDDAIGENLYCLSDLVQAQREGVAKEVYTSGSIQGILEQFLSGYLLALTQSEIILTWRAHQFFVSEDVFEADRQLQPVLPRVRQQKEEIAAFVSDMRSLEDGAAGRSMHASALIHLRWLVHRHTSRWRMQQFFLKVQWSACASRDKIFASVEAQREHVEHHQASELLVVEDVLHFPSQLSPLVSMSVPTVVYLSFEDREIESELELLRTELGVVPTITQDDGFMFGNAVYTLMLDVVKRISLSLDAVPADELARKADKTWKKKLYLGSSKDALRPQLSDLAQAVEETVAALEHVDADLKEELAISGLEQAHGLAATLKERANSHVGGIVEAFKDPLIFRTLKGIHAGVRSKGARASNLELNKEKLNALFTLRAIALRIFRRRMLGILNYFVVIESQLSVWNWLAQQLDQSEADAKQRVPADKATKEFVSLIHSITVDADGVVHCIDRDGMDVVYDEALSRFSKLESRLLLLGSHFVRRIEKQKIPNKSLMLHDLFSCELSFLEAKLMLVNALLDALQHSCEVVEQQNAMQQIVTVIHTPASVDIGASFVSCAYEVHISVLNKQADMIHRMCAAQQLIERTYMTSTLAKLPPSADVSGFGMSINVDQHRNAHRELTFQVFPGASFLRHRVSDIFPSIGIVPSFLTLSDAIANELVRTFANGHAIVTLAFQEAFLDEALPIWISMMEWPPPDDLRMPVIMEDPFHIKSIIDDIIRDDLGAINKNHQMRRNRRTSTTRGPSHSSSIPASQQTAQSSKLLQNPPSAADAAAKDTPPSPSKPPPSPGQAGVSASRRMSTTSRRASISEQPPLQMHPERRTQLLLAALETVHVRWSLSRFIWEATVVEVAAEEALGVLGAAPSESSSSSNLKTPQKEDPPETWRLAHEGVGDLPLKISPMVGGVRLADCDLESWAGVKGTLADGGRRKQLRLVLQMEVMRRHLGAVCLLYAVHAWDAMLTLPDDANLDGTHVNRSPVARQGSGKALNAVEEAIQIAKEGLKVRWPRLELSPAALERVKEVLVRPQGVLAIAESIMTVGASLSHEENVDRYCSGVTEELAIPSLVVQAAQEMWHLRRVVKQIKEAQALVLSTPRVAAKNGLPEGAVLTEDMINVWRIPLASEIFCEFCQDKRALQAYVRSLRAMHDIVAAIDARSLCFGDGSAASEQRKRDLNRFRDAVTAATSNGATPERIASLLASTRRHLLYANALSLQRSVTAFLQERNDAAFRACRSLAAEARGLARFDANLYLRGLPRYKTDDVERVWGSFEAALRSDNLAGVHHALMAMHSAEKKTVFKQLRDVDAMVLGCLRSNNVYPERQPHAAAELRVSVLADVHRFETLKARLVQELTGKGEPTSADELTLLRVTYEKHQRKAEFFRAGRPEREVGKGDVPERGEEEKRGGEQALGQGRTLDGPAIQLKTGYEQEVRTLLVDVSLLLINHSQERVRGGATKLLQGLQNMVRLDEQLRQQTGDRGKLAKPEPVYQFMLKKFGQIAKFRTETAAEDGTLRSLCFISKEMFYRLVFSTAKVLRSWQRKMTQRVMEKETAENAELRLKVRQSERNCQWLDDLVRQFHATVERRTFQTLVDRNEKQLYMLSAISTTALEMARTKAQAAADTENKVMKDFNGSIEMLKDELASLKANLHSDCIRWQSKINETSIDIVREEAHQVKGSVIRRVRQLLAEPMNTSPSRPRTGAAASGEAAVTKLQKEQKELQTQLSLDIAFLRFKKCVRASIFAHHVQTITSDRKTLNEERYGMQHVLAPMPGQLEVLSKKLEAVELEMGSLKKDLEAVNKEKVALLAFKVITSKKIAATQAEHGFILKEGADQHLSVIDEILAMDETIEVVKKEKAEHEEFTRSTNRFADDTSDDQATELRQLRRQLAAAKRGKQYAYRNLKAHREEEEVWGALMADRNPTMMAGFMETKTRQVEHWAQALQEENALLLAALEQREAAALRGEGETGPVAEESTATLDETSIGGFSVDEASLDATSWQSPAEEDEEDEGEEGGQGRQRSLGSVGGHSRGSRRSGNASAFSKASSVRSPSSGRSSRSRARKTAETMSFMLQREESKKSNSPHFQLLRSDTVQHFVSTLTNRQQSKLAVQIQVMSPKRESSMEKLFSPRGMDISPLIRTDPIPVLKNIRGSTGHVRLPPVRPAEDQKSIRALDASDQS